MAHVLEKINLMLYKLGAEEETAAINGLLSDLDEEPAKTHLADINAQEWVEELDLANRSFVEISGSRAAEIASDDTPTGREAFGKLEFSMKLVCSVLDAHLGYGQPADIQDIVNQANQFIKEANASAKLSRPRGGDEE